MNEKELVEIEMHDLKESFKDRLLIKNKLGQ